MGMVRGDNSLFFASGLDNSGLRGGAKQAIGIVQGLASSIGRINPFAALATAALTAFGAISAQAYKMVLSFEHAMKEVETISGATQKDFKGISQSVFELTKITPDGPEKLARAYYQIVSAGYDGAEGLKLLETASKAAVGGVTDTITAADGLTTVLNAFGIAAENSNEVADVMFKTVQLGKTTFSELASNLSTVAPIAAASGIRFEEIAGAVATLTKQGVPTAQAMTQIRSAIIGANEVLGDGWSRTMTLQNAFRLLYDSAGGSQTKLQEMVGRVEAVSAVLGVAGKNAKGAAGDLEAMTNAVGASEKAFKGMVSSNRNEWAILGNRIKATTKGIGDAVLGVSNDIAGFLNSALEDSDALKKSFDEQRASLFKMKNALEDSNTSEEERSRIIGEINEKYKDYLGGITAEKLSNEELLKVLDKVNDAYVLRYKFEKRRKELEEALNKQGDLELELDDLGTLLEDQIAHLQRIADDNGVTLKVDPLLSDNGVLRSIYEQLGGVDGAIETVHGKYTSSLRGFAGGSIEKIEATIKKRKSLTAQLEKQTKEVEKLTAKNKSLNKAELDTEEGRVQSIELIKNSRTLEELSRFNDFTDKEIVKALKARKKVVAQLEEIRSLKDKKGLSNYLRSENEEIKEAAKARRRILNTDFTLGGGLDKFIELLDKKKGQYESYENHMALLGKEAAGERFATLLKEGEDYGAYLQGQLEKFRDHEEKKDAIVNAAAGANVVLRPREETKPLEIDPIGVKLDLGIDMDTASYEAVNNKIKSLEEKARKAQDTGEQRALGEKIKAEKIKLEAIEERIYGAKKAEKRFYRTLRSLSRKGLIGKREELKEAQKALDKNTEEGARSYEELQDRIRKINEEIGKDIAGMAQEFSGAFSGLSDMFSKLGDEDTAQLLGQLSGVADGVAQIASGNVIGGSLGVLNSALSVEVVSDTAKFEAAIKELEKAIDRLDHVISKSVGRDKITNRSEAIKDLEALEKQADLAKKAELAARKEVKLLGIRIGKKGKGSGTSPEKLEELEQRAEDARRKAGELREQLDELYTGTTEATIVDSIISGLKEGKRTVADFADNFKDLMQDAMLEAFQIKYLEKEVDKFYKAFADAGEDSDFTAEEIDTLRHLYHAMVQGAQDDLDTINQILEDSGIGSLGSEDTQRRGLAGGIEKITEDQANIMAGTLNSIRIDIVRGLEVAVQNSQYLSQIAANTSYNRYLENLDGMDVRLKNIETLLT